MPRGRGFARLSQLEETARTALEPDLRDALRTAGRTFDFLEDVARFIVDREPKKAAKVCVQLLHRVANDLRATALLAEAGYSAQALTVAASLFEAALSAAYVGGDEARAEEWQSHSTKRPGFRTVRQLIDDVFKWMPDAERQRRHDIYGELCLPKHVNPLFQSRIGFSEKDGNLFLFNGPDGSPAALYAIHFALANASQTAVGAAAQVALAFEPLGDEGLRRVVDSIDGDLRLLDHLARERWPENAAGAGEPTTSGEDQQ